MDKKNLRFMPALSSLMDRVTLSDIHKLKQSLEDATKEDMDRCSEAFIQSLVNLSLVIMKKVKTSKHYEN